MPTAVARPVPSGPVPEHIVAEANEDLDRLALRVFSNDDGQKLLAWLRQTVLEQPVALPGSDSSYAYYREGQNSIVRDIEARLIRARKL